MEHVDEKTLDILNAAEKTSPNILEGPVKIRNRIYEFEQTSFLGGRLSLYIPQNFIDMPSNLREIKYPSCHRPKIIKTDETGSINITLNQIDSDLSEELVKELTNGMKNIIKKTNPSNLFFTDGVEKVNGKNIGYFEFKSPALDEEVYNIMFFFEFGGKTVMGTFLKIILKVTNIFLNLTYV